MSQAQAQLDELFACVFQDLCELSLEQAAIGTSQVVEMSSSFLHGDASASLRDFHRLYFGNAAASQAAESINKEVDDLFDQLAAMQAAGQNLETAKTEVKENESAKMHRLSVAGLQRQLESFIMLGKDVRDKLLPVLSVLQFEDVVRQRIAHLKGAVALFAKTPDAKHTKIGYQNLAEDVALLLTSQKERELFYAHVLHAVAPQGHDEGFLDFGLGDDNRDGN